MQLYGQLSKSKINKITIFDKFSWLESKEMVHLICKKQQVNKNNDF